LRSLDRDGEAGFVFVEVRDAVGDRDRPVTGDSEVRVVDDVVAWPRDVRGERDRRDLLGSTVTSSRAGPMVTFVAYGPADSATDGA
jgi:hypothetical protein